MKKTNKGFYMSFLKSLMLLIVLYALSQMISVQASETSKSQSSATLKLSAYVLPHVFVTQSGSIVTNDKDTKFTIVKESISESLRYTVTVE